MDIFSLGPRSGYKFCHIMQLLLIQLFNLVTLSVSNFLYLPNFGAFSPQGPPKDPQEGQKESLSINLVIS